MHAEQDAQGCGCQDILGARHEDGMWYRRVGKWLQCMGQMYQEWEHEVNDACHVLGLRCTHGGRIHT